MIAFALIAALSLGMYSVLAKVLVRYRLCDPGLVTWGIGLGTGAVSLVILLIHPYPFPREALWYLILMAGVVLLGHWLLSKAMQEGDASTVVPLLSLKIPFTAILSIWMLRETHPASVYLAVGVSALGVALFGIGRQQKAQGGYGRHPLLAVALACGSALAYALFDQITKLGLAHAEPLPLAVWMNVMVGGLCLALMSRKHYRRYRIRGVDWALFLLGGVLMMAGSWTFLAAIQKADGVTIPNILLGTRGFFALAMGFALGRAIKIPMERQSGMIYLLRLVGTLLLFGGILLVLLK